MKLMNRFLVALLALVLLCGVCFGAAPAVRAADVAVLSETTFKSEDAAVAQIRQYMADRIEEFTIRIESRESSGKKLIERMMETAMEHTGDPVEGDYLLWQMGGWTASITTYSLGTGFEYIFNIEVTYYTTAEQEAEVDAAVAQLLSQWNLSGKSDYQKVCTVYDYVCGNVTYDYDNLNNSSYLLKYTAYAALVNKTAVCQGYALLMYRLLLELGVENRIIIGVSGGEYHAWNIVKLDGLYYNLDSTWDAGMSEYSYFLICRENFTEHTRDLEYETMEFHRKHPMSAADYAPGAKPVADKVIREGSCGNTAYWELTTEGRLTISGTGAVKDYPYSASREYLAPWEYWEEDIKTVVVEEGITGIGTYNFCDMVNLVTVTLPSTLRRIGDSAFSRDSSLKTVTIPNGVTDIGKSVFYDCDALTDITVPASVTQIGSTAFACCDSLTAVIIEGAPSIGSSFVNDCKVLTAVYFRGGVPVFDRLAFNGAKVTCYYPSWHPGWTEAVRQNYGGTVTWAEERCGGNHTAVKDSAVAATCTQSGLTEGSHCAVCSQVIVAQQKVAATGHSYGSWKTVKEATTRSEGLAERTCSGCGAVEQKTLEKLDAPATEPETTEPEKTEPEMTEPEETEPEVTNPEETEPEETDPTEPAQTDETEDTDPTMPSHGGDGIDQEKPVDAPWLMIVFGIIGVILLGMLIFVAVGIAAGRRKTGKYSSK